ncbi:unnamed protein product [Sphenostylis stenocarpa]|uniref:Uncharacterized protein n=1 Tax=Sphenostylis stenocarpa TaxID=92480 RepID=A0AA86VBZ0_9FABA|nr:unnamed protein product [Sphenostylis stenocarpa]
MESLSSLQLFGKLLDKLQMNRLHQNLTDLTLEKLVCATGSFPQLQVLRFWNLRELQEWDVKEGMKSGPVEIRHVQWKHLKTLRLIKLHKMSKPFMKDILNCKKALLDDVEIDYN